jgi:hypothetical protein
MEEYDKALTQYLEGLAVCVEQELPDTPPEVPAVGMVGAREGNPNDPGVRAAREENARQVEAARRAKFERDMISHRDILVQQIVTLFDEIPFDEEKLREQAKQIVRDGMEIDRLVYKIKAHLEGKEGDRQDENDEPGSDDGSLLPGSSRSVLAMLGLVSRRMSPVKVTGAITYTTS